MNIAQLAFTAFLSYLPMFVYSSPTAPENFSTYVSHTIQSPIPSRSKLSELSVFLPHLTQTFMERYNITGQGNSPYLSPCHDSVASFLKIPETSVYWKSIAQMLYKIDSHSSILTEARTQLEGAGMTLELETVPAKHITKRQSGSIKKDIVKSLKKLEDNAECEAIGIVLPREALNNSIHTFFSPYHWLSLWYCGPSIKADAFPSQCGLREHVISVSRGGHKKSEIIIADSSWYFNINDAVGTCQPDYNSHTLLTHPRKKGRKQKCQPVEYRDVGILTKCRKNGRHVVKWTVIKNLIATKAACVWK